MFVLKMNRIKYECICLGGGGGHNEFDHQIFMLRNWYKAVMTGSHETESFALLAHISNKCCRFSI